MEKLDNLDRRLLNLLQDNSKLSMKELGSMVGLSVTPTFERIKRYEKSGIIEKYVVILNKDKIGKGLTVYCNITLKEQSKAVLENFEKEVSTLSEVIEIVCVSGVYDYQLKIVSNDMKSYNDFVINKLCVIKNIGTVQSSFVMQEIKTGTAIKLEASRE
jgi:Lrp/AsnC family transcriptional regulator, leucine-responsive regulatory protein